MHDGKKGLAIAILERSKPGGSKSPMDLLSRLHGDKSDSSDNADDQTTDTSSDDDIGAKSAMSEFMFALKDGDEENALSALRNLLDIIGN